MTLTTFATHHHRHNKLVTALWDNHDHFYYLQNTSHYQPFYFCVGIIIYITCTSSSQHIISINTYLIFYGRYMPTFTVQFTIQSHIWEWIASVYKLQLLQLFFLCSWFCLSPLSLLFVFLFLGINIKQPHLLAPTWHLQGSWKSSLEGHLNDGALFAVVLLFRVYISLKSGHLNFCPNVVWSSTMKSGHSIIWTPQ